MGVVLHCGDITENGGIDQHIKAIDGLASIDAELKLVIEGNHDIDLDSDFYEKECQGDTSKVNEALAVWKGKLAKDANVIFLEEGTNDSGATFKIYASPYTPKYGVSAFQYPSNQDRYNAAGTPPWATNVSTASSTIPRHIDIAMTHGPPKYVLDACTDGSSGGCEHLRRAIQTTKPLLHCFGHIHSGWGARRAKWDEALTDDGDFSLLPEDFVGKNSSRKRGYASLGPAVYEQLKAGEQTLFVNAAVGNDEGEMENVPWVVDLELQRQMRKRKRGDVEE